MIDDTGTETRGRGVFSRILSYIGPYRTTVAMALVAMVVATASELLSPIILQRAVDDTILNEFRRIPVEYSDDPVVVDLLSSDSGVNIEGYLYIPGKSVSNITGAALREAESLGVVDPETWYVFPATEELEELTEGRETFTSGEGYTAIRMKDLEDFSADERQAIRRGDFAGLKKISLLFLVILAAGLIASFLQVYLMALTGQNVMIDLRVGLFGHLLRQALSYLNKRPVGKLVTRASNDVETINELFAQVATSLLRDLTIMAGVLGVLFFLNSRLAFITLMSLPPVIVLTFIFRIKARDAYRRVRSRVSAINTFLSEHISGMNVVQMFAREAGSYRQFEGSNRDLLKANLGEMYVFATFRPIVDLLASVSVGVVLYWGAKLFGGGSISLGVLIAFINLVEKFYQPLKDISEQFTILQSALAGGERVFHTLDEQETLEPGPAELAPEGVKGDIEFRNVSFSYNPGEQVLRDITLRVRKGETAALVGYTGAGKTTIANLLTRLWDIDRGEITLDGRDIRSYTLQSLRRAIQPVDQDVFLFSGTLRDNISLGRDLDTETIVEASRAVSLHDFIESLPEGYDTPVTEGGSNLSSGQRQLLSFARVIAHNPRVLILDEATANIDTQTERLVQSALKTVLRGRTSLVIAHRLSTIKDADRIFVLSGGRLVEEGRHDELIRKKGAYYSLYKLQYG